LSAVDFVIIVVDGVIVSVLVVVVEKENNFFAEIWFCFGIVIIDKLSNDHL
jgi:hypothetical protein